MCVLKTELSKVAVIKNTESESSGMQSKRGNSHKLKQGKY